MEENRLHHQVLPKLWSDFKTFVLTLIYFITAVIVIIGIQTEQQWHATAHFLNDASWTMIAVIIAGIFYMSFIVELVFRIGFILLDTIVRIILGRYKH